MAPSTSPGLELREQQATRYDLRPYLFSLAEVRADLPITQVAGPELASRFVPVGRLPYGGETRVTWLRLRVKVAAESRTRWLLVTDRILLWGNNISLYQIKNGQWQSRTIWLGQAMSEREFADTNGALSLDDQKAPLVESEFIYIKLERIGKKSLILTNVISIKSEEAYFHDKLNDWLAQGLVLGILIIMIVYNLILYLSTRDRSYAWFVISLVGYLTYFAANGGIGEELIWPEPPLSSYGRFVGGLGVIIIIIGSGRFITHYLQIFGKYHWYQLATALCATSMSGMLVRNIIDWLRGGLMNVVIYSGIAGAFCLATLVIIINKVLKGSRPALFLLAATGLLALGALTQILVMTGAVPTDFLARHAMQAGVALQVALLSLGLADRLRIIRQELAERDKSERLLRAMLPAPIAERLKRGESPIADRFAEVTVLFADIAGFTPLSAGLSPEQVVRTLNTLFSRFDALTQRFGLEKIKTIGDCYMVVGGLPSPRLDHACAVADLALALVAELQALSTSTSTGELGIEALRAVRMRVGMNCGSAVAGVIGTQKPAYDLWGDTVNLASRMESHGEPGRIQCSEAIYLKLKDAFVFADRGEVEVRGKGMMRTYYLISRQPAASPTG